MGANMSEMESTNGVILRRSTSQLVGANFSDYTRTQGLVNGAKTNQLIEFHSKKQWRANFDASKETNKLIAVYFTAPWCGPCKVLEPYVRELAAKYTDVQFVKIDVDKLEDVAMEFELIDIIPTIVLVKKGKEIDRVVGAKKEELQMKTEKHRLS